MSRADNALAGAAQRPWSLNYRPKLEAPASYCLRQSVRQRTEDATHSLYSYHKVRAEKEAELRHL
jgi:hypothetical protein